MKLITQNLRIESPFLNNCIANMIVTSSLREENPETCLIWNFIQQSPRFCDTLVNGVE